MGNFIKAQSAKLKVSLKLRALSRIHDGRFRAQPIRERREVDVVAGAGADGAQQGAVHPRYQRSIQFARPAESLAVFVHVLDEDILHLEIPTRVEERQRVREALGG